MSEEEQLYEDLRKKIKALNNSAWYRQLTGQVIKKWAEQFRNDPVYGPKAELEMMYLLSKFLYFGLPEVREIMKSLFRDYCEYPYIKQVRQENGFTHDIQLIEEETRKRIRRTRFLPIGNPSESGTHLLYLYRQENGLPKELFLNAHEIFTSTSGAQTGELRTEDVDVYIFIDDYCGSGTQATAYSKDIVAPIKQADSSKTVYYHAMFATKAGVEYVRKNTAFDSVDAVFMLDSTFCAFDADSRVYSNKPSTIDKTVAESIARRYGKMLCKDPHALGYKNGQQLLAFYHNTPDNTLPIFWSHGADGFQWQALFPRYSKLYGDPHAS